MENISGNSACGNVTGWKKLEILPTDELKGITIINSMLRKIEPMLGKSFGHVKGKNIFVSASFSEGAYEISIACDFIWSRQKADFLFNRMKEQKFIIKATDKNNTIWASGTEKEPLNFRFSHVGESDSTGRHYYKLEFFRNSTENLYNSIE